MSKNKSLLVEIGAEELPPSLIKNLLAQLKDNIASQLKELDIPFNNNIEQYSSPRRLAVIIHDIPEVQEKKEIEIKGPPKNKAFDESGNPTKVGIGFSKKYNLEPNQLKFKEVNGAEYVFVETVVGGNKVNSLLKEIIPTAIKNISGDKLMKWGNEKEKFVRPVRWIVSLFGEEIIEFNYADIKSGNVTYGHRFIGDKQSGIETSISTYKDDLKNKGMVIACPDERKELILDLIKEEVRAVNPEDKNFVAQYLTNFSSSDKKLLDTVTNITECPIAITCKYDDEFKKLPHIVIETVLHSHQKYFMVSENCTEFIVITNGTTKNGDSVKETIKSGNEKVARARLNDAMFFCEEDQKRPFKYEERVNSLEKVTFQKGLGNMKDKVDRIIKLSEYLYDKLSLKSKPPCTKEDTITAAQLCKLDLVTQMVFEMPELQGIMGSIYAKNSNFSDQICYGIEEHYLNNHRDNHIAHIIGFADALDNIVSLFAIGKIPTSSSDPFGLISQANWIIGTIEYLNESSLWNADLNLESIIDEYINVIEIEDIKNKITPDIIKHIKTFFIERIKLRYKAHQPKDLVDSVLSTTNPLHNIASIDENIQYAKKAAEDKEFLVAAKRLVRIVKDSSPNGGVKEDLFNTEDEKVLYKEFASIKNISAKSKEEYFKSLLKLTKPINNFFDNVLVNDPDPNIKQNRHSLLLIGKDLFEEICDFNLIVERG